MIELRVISLTEDGKPPLYEEATRTARQNDGNFYIGPMLFCCYRLF